MYPIARAYMAQGDPLYNELKALFAPDNGPQDGPADNDEMIIIMDSDDEDFPPLPQLVVHALPALDQVDWNYILVPDSPIAKIVVISSDDDGYDLDGYFDSDADLDYSGDENHIPVVMIEEAIGEMVDPIPNINPAITTALATNEDESTSLTAEIPIPSASLAAIQAEYHCHASVIL
ncbi:hypothetical protein ACS0TY_027246 [Phlomoides rotata]